MLGQDELTSETLAARCGGDGEFRIAARHWTGGLRLESPAGAIGVTLTDGKAVAGAPAADAPGAIVLNAADEVWAELLAQAPKRLMNDVFLLLGQRLMASTGDAVTYAQYYPAATRALELLRPPAPAAPPLLPTPKPGTFDSPVGRYVHLDLEGQDYRVYFEEAGSGIPVLMQHTAGCHGAQWRHLFERPEITDHFRLIAYDLPFHGKSLPPVGPKWWAEEYRLTGVFLRSVPVSLAAVLGLERPVFMGCSVGGLLALDLALRHPDVFAAVISLEGALRIGGDIEALDALWHPQISNEYKARLMNGLMSPTSPEPFRKETSQVYASGWPPAFLGDLYYYVSEFDLTADAGRIDTVRTPVHILTGEYDGSGTLEHGEAAHRAIAGSTFTPMPGVGHFPMSENPDAFIGYLLPVLDKVRAAWNAAATQSPPA